MNNDQYPEDKVINCFNGAINHIIVTLLLIVYPCMKVTAQSWSDISCGTVLNKTDSGYQIFIQNKDGYIERNCEILFWPIKNPVALLKCTDDGYIQMEAIDDSNVILGDEKLALITESNGLCD